MPQRLTLFIFTSCVLLLSACGRSASPVPTPTAAATAFRLLPPNPTAYAALGASETYGVGAQPHTAGYAYQVARALRAHPFVNLGIPGTTLDAGYQTELTSALTIRPHLCTLFFGFNDIRAHIQRAAFLQDFRDTVVTLRRAGCHVLIVGLPDLAVLPSVRRSGMAGVAIAAIVTSWNAGMRAVAARTGARFLDLSRFSRELETHPEYISPDGLHPSNAGYTRLAQVLLATIRQNRMFGS